jgi:hypothetical protein
MRAEGLAPRLIVLSEKEPGPVPAEETAETIERFSGGVPVRIVPRGGAASLAEFF